MRFLALLAAFTLLNQSLVSGAEETSIESVTTKEGWSIDHLRVQLRKAEKNVTANEKRIDEVTEELDKKEEEIVGYNRVFEERNATWAELHSKAEELKRPWAEERRKAEEVLEEFEQLEKATASAESQRILAERDLEAANRALNAAKETRNNLTVWRQELGKLPSKVDLTAQVDELKAAVRVKKAEFDRNSTKADRRKAELSRRGCDRRPNDSSCAESSRTLTYLLQDLEAARRELEKAEADLAGPNDALVAYDRRLHALQKRIADAGAVHRRVQDAETTVADRQLDLSAAADDAAAAAAAVQQHRPAADAARLQAAAATPAPAAAAAVAAAQRADDALDDAKAVKRRLEEEAARLSDELGTAHQMLKASQAEAASLKAMLDTAQLTDDEKNGLSTGSIAGIIVGAMLCIMLIAGGALVYMNREKIQGNKSQQPMEMDPLVADAPPAPQVRVRAMQAIEDALREAEENKKAEVAPRNSFCCFKFPSSASQRDIEAQDNIPKTSRAMEQQDSMTPGSYQPPAANSQRQPPPFGRVTQETNRSDSGYDDASPRTTGGQSVDRKSYTAALLLPDAESLPKSPVESEFLKKFKPISILGRGGYGCVFKAECRLIGKGYAIKRIPIPSRVKSKEQNVLREAAFLADLEHESIVRYINCWLEHPPSHWQRETDEKMLREMNSTEHIQYYPDNCAFLYIQMELCRSTLAEWLKKNQTRDCNLIKELFKQIVSAVDYIHVKGIIHRDLKPGNILFASEDRVKICDLGIAAVRKITDGQENAKTRTFGQGTSMYMAPEQKGCAYTAKVDIFALGLILAELCVPMTDEQAEEVFDNYRKGQKNDVLCSQPEVQTIVCWLTKLDPSERPECKEILVHEFLAKSRSTVS